MRTPPIVFPGAAWAEAAPESQGLDSRRLGLAMDMVRAIAKEQGNSQSLVIRNGRLVWKGPDIDNRHTVWSCTKSFLSIALGLLVDDGKCTLETRAAQVLPGMERYYPTVKLRHLATFTSGYNHNEVTPECGPFEPAPPLYAPGEKFMYSWQSDQLANILTHVAGEPLRDLFRRRVAEPIGMNPSAWSWGDWGEVDGLPVCGGSGSYEKGIAITAREMARVAWLVACGGRWGDRQILSAAWVRQSTAPQVPATVPPYDPEGWYVRLPGTYGLNWWTNGVDARGRRMWPAAPPSTCAIQGNNNNFAFAIPAWRMVLVRLGTDGRIDNDRYDDVFARLRAAFLAEP